MNTKPIIDNSNIGVRSNQPLGFNWLGSTDFGRIVPFHVEEMLPTDKVVRLHPNIEMQMLPFVGPTFGRIDLYVHYFFVPTRLLWKNAPDFFSKTGAGANSIPPYLTYYELWQKYHDYDVTYRRAIYKHWTSLGLPPFFALDSAPTGALADVQVSMLPFRAYDRVWWDFFRDPEVLPDSNEELYLTVNSGHESPSALSDEHLPRNRSLTDVWFANLFATNGSENHVVNVDLASPQQNPGFAYPSSPGSINSVGIRRDSAGNVGLASSSPYNVPSGSNSVVGQFETIEARKAEALTRMAERLSLGGKREIDRYFAIYGVKPNYLHMQMSQYIGGSKSPVSVQDITSSADTTQVLGSANGSPLGMKGGSGYCALEGLDIDFTAPEHGYIVGVLSVVPKLHFVQGLGKRWLRNTFDDFFRRELEHVSLVAVPNHEIGVEYQTFNAVQRFRGSDNMATFAFDQPYYDYKRHPDILAGDFMYYHNTPVELGDEDSRNISYMQSMGIWTDYAENRLYDPENLQVKNSQANSIFWYLGGEVWDDVDDHFHVNIDVDCVINRPMDGFAVPTLETTENPHQSTTSLGGDAVL